MRFSANLGFLWTEHTLPDAIRAASAAGFDAVECHWPYAFDPAEVVAALQDTGLKMLGLNTSRGDPQAGENGLSAVPGREEDARATIDQAISYAAAIGTGNIHIMAGFASGRAARAIFVENLKYAAARSAQHDINIVIEPLNHHDAPGYFLQYCHQARDIIDDVGSENLKLMFDCYHVQIMEGDLSRRLKEYLPVIGHIQFASVPDRSEPDSGELNYRYLFEVIEGLGYGLPLGAEYRPTTTTDAGLGWMSKLRPTSG